VCKARNCTLNVMASELEVCSGRQKKMLSNVRVVAGLIKPKLNPDRTLLSILVQRATTAANGKNYNAYSYYAATFLIKKS
jgi:hypothetical protein